uniref:FCP1 homology domain-containing protein n=1 Tax=Oryctolagus cuniculus TaxID=9986 RepID=A0A5F9D0Y7_RABIT
MGLLEHSSIITQAQREDAMVLTKQDPRDLPVPRSDIRRSRKDLKMLVLDNLPASYSFHPENVVPVQCWFDYMADTELLNLSPNVQELNAADDVYSSLGQLRAHSLPASLKRPRPHCAFMTKPKPEHLTQRGLEAARRDWEER